MLGIGGGAGEEGCCSSPVRCQGLPGRRGCLHSEDANRCGVSEAKWGKEEVQRGRQGGSHGNLVTYSGIDQISNYIKEKKIQI